MLLLGLLCFLSGQATITGCLAFRGSISASGGPRGNLATYSLVYEMAVPPELTAGRIRLSSVMNLFVNWEHRGEDDDRRMIV